MTNPYKALALDVFYQIENMLDQDTIMFWINSGEITPDDETMRRIKEDDTFRSRIAYQFREFLSDFISGEEERKCVEAAIKYIAEYERRKQNGSTRRNHDVRS